jgi:hypothetical protein
LGRIDRGCVHPNYLAFVDKLLTDCCSGRYIIITEEEARAQWPLTYKDYYHPQRRGYVTG